MTKMPESLYSGTLSSDFERSERHMHGSSQDQTYEKLNDKSVPLTTRESVELFQNAVDAARGFEYQKTLQVEAPGQAFQPNLTVDLRKKKLSQIPKEVIAIIRQDVERLQLAYNGISHIAYEFTQCSALKYLNLRENRFKEIPKALFGLPQLEILDMSRNKLTEVPDEIEHLKALRVLSLQTNNIRDLPYCLGTIITLRLLKVMGNPVNPTLQRILDGNGMSPNPALIKDENERDTVLTKMLTEHMRSHTARRDSGEDSTSDGPLETPRALSRFPVQPQYGNQYGHSTSGSESASEFRSPNFTKPILPARSHNRAPSSQYGTLHNAAPRRPGLAPLALGNERNRSNSESVLQSTQNNKVKRLGVVTKKHSDLGVLDEMRTNRNSYHLRGQSHGSALRNGVRAEESSPSSDPTGIELRRGIAGRRLASLPELQPNVPPSNGLVETSRGVLFSLNMLVPLTSTLAVAVTEGKTRRSSLERVFSSAAMHIDQLDQELLQLHGLSNQSTQLTPYSRRAVLQATRECATTHERILDALARIAMHLSVFADPRHFRSLMLGLYGSLSEMLLASKSYGVDYYTTLPQKQYAQRVSTISEASNEGDYLYTSDRSATPTQRRKFARRWKNGINVPQPMKDPNLPTPGFQTALPMYTNGRSRSNSRATPLHSSTSSSVMSTPRSGESFSSATLVIRSRSGSVNTTSEQLWADKQETAQFDKIFAVLKKSVDDGLAVLPQLESAFLEALDNANKQQYPNPRACGEWSILANSATHCLEVTEMLKSSLSTVLLNDREARNVRTFWQLAKTFLDSCGNLLLAIKEAIKHELFGPNLRHQLRPIHTSTREAARLIATSPWNHLTFEIDPQATPLPTTQLQIQQPALNSYQHRTRGSGGSAAGGSSPYTNVPATPLSAALGPAAQATVPASQVSAPPPTPASAMPPTPGTASLERSFEGDIFQRAETYQSLQQTMIPRRQVL